MSWTDLRTGANKIVFFTVLGLAAVSGVNPAPALSPVSAEPCARAASSPKPGSDSSADMDAVLDLTWRFEKGKPFYETQVSETKQYLTIPGSRPVEQTQKQTCYWSFVPLGKDPKGNWLIRQRTEGMKLDIDTGGTRVVFDSTKPDPRPKDRNTAFYRALIGAELVITLARDMTIVKVDGKESLARKLEKADPRMKRILEDMHFYAKDGSAGPFDFSFSALPGRVVKRGECWKRVGLSLMTPWGSIKEVSDFAFEGLDPSRPHLARIREDLKMEYTPPAVRDSKLPFQIVKTDIVFAGTGGTVLFDITRRRISESRVAISGTGKLTIQMLGKNEDIELTQFQLTTTKTTDENPIKERGR